MDISSVIEKGPWQHEVVVQSRNGVPTQWSE